ncbi:MAG TPA: hypothetical protein VGT61_07295 [Thermomicrobiales bacterium]|nr:hypothetical protein [Thermomicrobiales bacterium]
MRAHATPVRERVTPIVHQVADQLGRLLDLVRGELGDQRLQDLVPPGEG